MPEYSWGLFIDIEGFSKQFETDENAKTRAIMALRDLMDAIINIGEKVYPGIPKTNYSERLFAHQFGDGFVITSILSEGDIKRCIAIAVSLMRHMLLSGYTCKEAIAKGHMAGINSCYPDKVSESDSGVINIGNGLMTTIPAMGTALIRAYQLSSKAEGSIIIIDDDISPLHYNDMGIVKVNKNILVDWVSTDSILSKEISHSANLKYGCREELLKSFCAYISQEPVPKQSWVDATRHSWRT